MEKQERIKVDALKKLKPASWLRRTVFWCWIGSCAVISGVTWLAANGGMFDPRTMSFPAILSMSFPFWIITLGITALINMFVCRKMALIQWVVALFCVGGLTDYFPLNLSGTKDVDISKGEHRLKVMTYNVFGFCDDEGVYSGGTNRTASAIIASGADIVFVQEIGFIADMPARHLTQAQVDSLAGIYPYSMFNEQKMVGILSRYPLEWVELPQPESEYAGFEAARLHVDSIPLLVVSVHLQSLGLNEEDRVVYHEMTSGDAGVREWKDAGKAIYDKIAMAMKRRATQAHMLRSALDSLPDKNILLAGDFNDINGCYAMRTICGDNLRATFTEVGRGPVVTYHKDRFLFNIDHILYGGNLRPLSIFIPRITSSDHYPVEATFAIYP